MLFASSKQSKFRRFPFVKSIAKVLPEIWKYFFSPGTSPRSPQGLFLETLESRLTPTSSSQSFFDNRSQPISFTFSGSGPGASPTVTSYYANNNQIDFQIPVMSSGFTGGVRVATGDINHDGIPDIIAGAGPSGGPRVQVLDGSTGTQFSGTIGSFFAYDSSFTGGVQVATADVNGDGLDDIITAPGAGGGPNIKIFSGSDGSVLASFYAFDSAFTGGCSIATSDFNDDGQLDLIVGAGIGGGPNVKVFDLSNLSSIQTISGPLGSFYAFDSSFTGGVTIGTNPAFADFTGDGIPDILVAQGPGNGSLVRVIDGSNGNVATEFSPFGQTVTGGLKVSTALVNDDSVPDIVVDSVPGVSSVPRVYNGNTFSQDTSLPSNAVTPFGPTTPSFWTVNVEAIPTGTTSVTTSGTPTVGGIMNLAVQINAASGGFAPTGSVNLTVNYPDSATSTNYTVNLTTSGTQGIASIPVTVASSGAMIISGTYNGDSNYQSGRIQGATVTIGNSGSGTAPIPGPDLITGPSPQINQQIQPILFGKINPAGYVGYVLFSNNDLPGNGLLGLNRTWSNNPSLASGVVGSGSTISDLPRLVQSSDSSLVQLIVNSAKVYQLDLVNGTYSSRFNQPFTVSTNGDGDLVLATDSGRVFTFWSFSTSLPAAQRGAFKSMLDEGGNLTAVQTWDSAGRPTEVTTVNATVTSSTLTESILYSYSPTSPNAGMLTQATLRRKIGLGSYNTVMTASYSYYVGSSSNGLENDLKTVVTTNASGAVTNTEYYRYYKDSLGAGYAHGLKYALGFASYKRVSALGDPDSLSDTQLSPYADHYFEYNSENRILKHVVAGDGNSSTTGGLGTYTYSYFTTTKLSTGFNLWKMGMVETNPEGGITTNYSNVAGQLMLSVYKDPPNIVRVWAKYNHYDGAGRIDFQADPAAVQTLPNSLNSFKESYGDLVKFNSNMNATALSDTKGLYTIYNYYRDNTASSTQAGSVAGYLKSISIKNGEGNYINPTDYNNKLLTTYDYYSHNGNGVNTTVYADIIQKNDTISLVTKYTYDSWITYTSGSTTIESAQPYQVTTTLPVVTTAQNGAGGSTGATTQTVFDVYGRIVWEKDAGGFLAYNQYDPATMAVIKTVSDVNVSNTSDYSGLPAGWSTPSGGGARVIHSMEVDAYGRTTKIIDGNGNVSYIVYNDGNQEIRIYSGWNGSTNTPTGPITLIRGDLNNGYSETLTYSTTPSVSNGRPTGQESVTGLVSLSRTYTNIAGQVTNSDSYFKLTDLTYTTDPNFGTEGTNYLRMRYAYDDYGRQNRFQTPAGTIGRTVFDKLGRPISFWIGMDDTPTTGTWSPNAPGTDLVKTQEAEYDNGNIGDSNLTQIIEYPGNGGSNRVTKYLYDWRNRLVGGKNGYEGSAENTNVNRVLVTLTYDNQDYVTQIKTFDGDGISFGSNATLTSSTSISYDNLGQIYQSKTYKVDPNNNGAIGNALTTNFWYDTRGNLIKSQEPGGLVNKSTYDGLSRVVKSYVTDGGGDTAYADASTVTGDTVLSQGEVSYDANSNPILVTSRERFHNASGTGELTPTTSRAYYSAGYYDVLDRLSSSVNFGTGQDYLTNNGLTFNRSTSVPNRNSHIMVTDYGYNSTSGLLDTVTDPKGIVDKSYFDAMARTTKTIQAYDGGAITGTTNKTTEFGYDSYGHQSYVKAYQTSTTYSQTQNIYGVTTSTSGLNSNDVLSAVQYPDKTTGNPSSSLTDTYTVNALGDVTTATDRLGTTHSYSYDVLGRITSDTINTLGSGLDGTVKRVDTAYDTQGNPYLFTSYGNTNGTTIVNQVQDKFNGFGQLINEYQSHSGAVNTSTTPNVGYTYVEAAGGANNSRQTGMVYPNGRTLTSNYNSGTDTTISRLSSISDSGTTLESYLYLGLNQAVVRSHPQPGVDLTYVKQSGESNGDGGDQYTGLDRFGRIVDQRWIKTSTSTATDRFQYGYDQNSNVLYKNNLVLTAQSELYHANGTSAGYDNLNQLTAFARGTLSDTNSDGIPDTIATATQSQSWATDGQGNFTSVTTNGTAQTRTYDNQNELTAVGSTSLTYDAAGNLKTDEQNRTYVYDAWGQLISVSVPGNSSSIQASYTYDALGHRITETSGGVTKDLYYSADWQVIEERVSNVVQTQYVWSPVYVDQMIERDRNADGNTSTGANGLSGLEERLYVQTDANFNVTALVDSSGNVVERYVYDPYGKVTILSPDGSTVRSTSSYAWQYLHQGGRQDTATGLLNFRNRDYSTSLMRWTSNDPMGFGGGDTNTYRYVGNGPGNGLDPSGLADQKQIQQIYDNYKNVANAYGNAMGVGSYGARVSSQVDDARALGFLKADSGKGKNKTELDEYVELANGGGFNYYRAWDDTKTASESLQEAKNIASEIPYHIKLELANKGKDIATGYVYGFLIEKFAKLIFRWSKGAIKYIKGKWYTIKDGKPVLLSPNQQRELDNKLIEYIAPSRALPRNAPEFGGFAHGISPDEISAINRRLGGATTLTGNVSTTLANAANREGFWNKAATIVRDIAGGHKFNDANKRTAQAVVEELMRRNGISTGVTPDQMKKIIQRVATGGLREIEDIASALRGF